MGGWSGWLVGWSGYIRIQFCACLLAVTQTSHKYMVVPLESPVSGQQGIEQPTRNGTERLFSGLIAAAAGPRKLEPPIFTECTRNGSLVIPLRR